MRKLSQRGERLTQDSELAVKSGLNLGLPVPTACIGQMWYTVNSIPHSFDFTTFEIWYTVNSIPHLPKITVPESGPQS